MILRATSIIGDTKAINNCCGRHLAFCLRKMVEKFDQPASIDLEQDEEILVYLSGDLQASTNSWVWGSAETGTHLSRRQKHGRPKAMSHDSDQTSPTSAQSPSWDSMLSQEEQQDWGDWQGITRAARYLTQIQEKRLRQPPAQPERPVLIFASQSLVKCRSYGPGRAYPYTNIAKEPVHRLKFQSVEDGHHEYNVDLKFVHLAGLLGLL